ncbi:hypothetical protein MMC22_008257 [Lobaria immixta]|nr:hypothetical protein [Lobaria immixta]
MSKDMASQSSETFFLWVQRNEARGFLARHGGNPHNQRLNAPMSEANDDPATDTCGNAPSTAQSKIGHDTSKDITEDKVEWVSVSEPRDNPDWVENDWLVLDTSEL